MTAGAWQLTTTTREKIAKGQFDLDTDTFKLALFLSTSNISTSSTTFAGLTNEVGTTDTGYTAGGVTVTFTFAGTTSLTLKFTDPQPNWTVGSAGLTCRYGVIYESGGDVVAYSDLGGGSDVVASSGNVLTVDGKTNAVLTMA